MTKEQVKNACLLFLNNKVTSLQNTLTDLEEDMKNESKSTAGDKHETSRAMFHNEQEKVQKQLHELLLQKSALEQIPSTENSSKISLGSLIKTNKGHIYLAIALGRLTIDNKDIFVLSAQSPLGAKLIGLTKNDSVTVNGIPYKIEEII